MGEGNSDVQDKLKSGFSVWKQQSTARLLGEDCWLRVPVVASTGSDVSRADCLLGVGAGLVSADFTLEGMF